MNMSFLWDDFKGWGKLDYTWLAIALVMFTGTSLLTSSSSLSMVVLITNVICVILVAQGKLSNYIWGTVAVVAYSYISYNNGYYGETILNTFIYLPLQFIGFYLWHKNRENIDDTATKTVITKKLTPTMRIIGVVSVPLCIVGLTYFLNSIGGKLALYDSSTTILSIVAMVLMVYRLKEQWYVWIIVNIISFYMWSVLYFEGNPDGLVIVFMWVLFLINSIYGCVKWHKRDYDK